MESKTLNMHKYMFWEGLTVRKNVWLSLTGVLFIYWLFAKTLNSAHCYRRSLPDVDLTSLSHTEDPSGLALFPVG